MIDRRTFLELTATGLLAFRTASAVADEKKQTFRTISYNVLAFRGFPRTRTTRDLLDANREQHPEMTAEALAAFAPDIITLQEGPSEEVVARFAAKLGMNYAYFPGGWKGNKTYPGGFPGAVVSRYAIEDSRNRPSAGGRHSGALFTRHLGYAKLAAPFGMLHVVSTHFHASEHDTRMLEAAAVIDLIKQLRETGPVLFQGDLNHRPTDPEYALLDDANLVDVGKKAGIGEEPTASSIRPRSRIDYIRATPDLAEKACHAAVLNTPPFIPTPDEPVSYALSDHLPVMAEFSLMT